MVTGLGIMEQDRLSREQQRQTSDAAHAGGLPVLGAEQSRSLA